MLARLTKKTTLLLALNIILGSALALVLFLPEDKQIILSSRTSNKPANDDLFSFNYADSSHSSVPGKSDYAVPKNERTDYLRSILDTLFFGRRGVSDEEKSIRIFQYVATSMRLKNNNGTATSMLKQGYAFCFGKSKAFTTLCRVAGMPSRQVSFMNISKLSSHVLSEVFYDNAWHLFDPTYGIFFYSRPQYDRQGAVLSFHDLIENAESGFPILGVPKTGVGYYNLNMRYSLVRTVLDNGDQLDDNGMSVAAYRNAIRTAFPVAYGSSDLISFPVDANISADSEQWFGQVNGSASDMGDYVPRFSGSHYLGQANPPGFHTWLIKTKPLSTIHIEYYSTGANPPELILVPLRAAKVIETTREETKTTFTFYTAGRTSIVSIYCPEKLFTVDAMRIFR
ncbi:MAG: transglutaminase-like domain-containing protein [Ignavibacteriae bacterium]|nr:transglutaminase-like domain-containing protein [Ignavibacteriota bacterium]